MKLTIVCDNSVTRRNLTGDWSFACVVEAHGRRLLFDTGASGEVLLANMRELGISSEDIDLVVISHDHWDHTGGLSAFLELRPVPVYVPAGFESPVAGAREVVRVDAAREIAEGVFSTGALEGRAWEQSLLVRLRDGVAVVTGCAHPGVPTILRAAAQWGRPLALVGGLHGFEQYDLLADMQLICPTHCTRHKHELHARFASTCIEGGVGRVIELE